MKYLKFLSFFFLGLCLVLLDVSFLSNFEVYGATVISSFVFLIILAISDRQEDFVLFSLSLVILFAVFSSLPLFIIFLNFVLLPLAFNLVRRKYLHVPNRFSAVIYLLAATFLFELVLVIWGREFNQFGFLAVAYFIIINTICGFFINIFYNSLRFRLTRETKIKI